MKVDLTDRQVNITDDAFREIQGGKGKYFKNRNRKVNRLKKIIIEDKQRRSNIIIIGVITEENQSKGVE